MPYHIDRCICSNLVGGRTTSHKKTVCRYSSDRRTDRTNSEAGVLDAQAPQTPSLYLQPRCPNRLNSNFYPPPRMGDTARPVPPIYRGAEPPLCLCRPSLTCVRSRKKAERGQAFSRRQLALGTDRTRGTDGRTVSLTSTPAPSSCTKAATADQLIPLLQAWHGWYDAAAIAAADVALARAPDTPTSIPPP